VKAHEHAQRFLEQLRAANDARLGTIPTRLNPAEMNDLVIRALSVFNPEQRRDPKIRAMAEQIATVASNGGDSYSELLAGIQDHIEKTAAARVEGLELESRRPLVGYLKTGQLHAVSMRVPARSDAYLVLLHDQMMSFAHQLSRAVTWAIPHGPPDADGMFTFNMSVRDVTERIETNPEVVGRFADIVVTYASTGNLRQVDYLAVTPIYARLGGMLRTSLEYFIMGHEYAHILLGHLDTAAVSKGVLPGATEFESLVYSWAHEFNADLLGMMLSINAEIERNSGSIDTCFAGISLFFDALDVMDRAVALLQTGDENARQLGSHPPSELRKQRLRDFLPKMCENDPARAEEAAAALFRAEIQGEVIRLLWERTRPILQDLHRCGVSAASTWRTIPKESGSESASRP
jgi:hypothetical protein